MDDPQPESERTAGEDTAETIDPKTLLILAATILMFAVLIFGWVFAGKILEKLEEGIKTIGDKIASSVESVVKVGEVVVQEVLKGTGTVINQISGIVDAFDDVLEPLLRLVADTAQALLDKMTEAVTEIIGILNALGDSINGALLLMINQLTAFIGTAINDTLGFIQTIFAPFFQ